MDVLTRMERAFLSQAVADAFCYPFEFFKPHPTQVTSAYCRKVPISISDDTQMAMFGLHAFTVSGRKGASPKGFVNDYLLEAYLDWYATQTKGRGISDLSSNPLMRKIRAPGNTCLGSLHDLAYGITRKNNSKGNGAVMRTLPFLFAQPFFDKFIAAGDLAVAGGLLTHHHPESSVAVSLYMQLGEYLLSLKTGDDYIQALGVFQDHLSTFARVDVATFGSVEQVHQWGSTGTALPALIAAFVALRNSMLPMVENPFLAMMVDCCVTAGDSDTVAAIAGGLFGLLFEPPVSLVTRLVERGIIVSLVNEAVEVSRVRPPVQEECLP